MKTLIVSALLIVAVALLVPAMNVTGQEASKSAGKSATTIFDPTADTPDVDSAVPTDLQELSRYLKDGAYRKFAARESAPHPSRGPHTNVGWPVRVFFDPTVNASMGAGNSSHPIGASIVKEMFDDSGVLQGWAVMVKTQADSAGGKGWFWYETTNVDNPTEVVAAGNGVQLCQGCHFIGKDFVLTTYPLQ